MTVAPMEGERLARVEEQLRGVREDIAELMTEMNRARQRLHKVEGVTALYVETQKENRRNEAEQYRRLGLRVQIMTVVLGLAAVVVPLVTIILSGK